MKIAQYLASLAMLGMASAQGPSSLEMAPESTELFKVPLPGDVCKVVDNLKVYDVKKLDDLIGDSRTHPY